MSAEDLVVERAVNSGLGSQAFHRGAQSNANSAWFFGVVGLVVGALFSWKVSIIFGVIVIWSVVRSMQATSVALRLEKLES